MDSRSGEVAVKSAGDDILSAQPFKATEIVTAIGRGFSEQNAMLLMDDDNRLHVMDIRDYAGKSAASMERIRGRIIGEDGRARRNIEQLGNSRVSGLRQDGVYNRIRVPHAYRGGGGKLDTIRRHALGCLRQAGGRQPAGEAGADATVGGSACR